MITAAKPSPKKLTPSRQEGASSRMAKTKQTAGKAATPRGGSRAAATKATPASFIDDNPILKNAVAQIEKEFGQGSIMPLGKDAHAAIEGIASGSLSVDRS